MSSKRILGFSVGLMTILLLIVIGWLIYTYQESERAAELRYNVFCEQLKPGMDRTEVRRILSQYGNFREMESSFKGGLSVVGIVFTDPATDRRFGGKSVVLVFENGSYIKATTPVFFSDANKPVCK